MLQISVVVFKVRSGNIGRWKGAPIVVGCSCSLFCYVFNVHNQNAGEDISIIHIHVYAMCILCKSWRDFYLLMFNGINESVFYFR